MGLITSTPRRMGARLALLVIGGLATAGLATASPALAAPATSKAAQARAAVNKTPYVISVGDSYISGEAGRWAGNTNGSSAKIDALGPTAYFDNANRTAERIPLCHRSWAAEVWFGGGSIYGQNLACSGAKTSTFTNSDDDFKPGLDFYSKDGKKGQALALRDFARGHTVKLVALSIGGNNFDFGDIVGACVKTFLSGITPYCKDDPQVLANFSAANVAAQTAKMKNGMLNIHKAMQDAGYHDSQYTIVVQNYEDAIPDGSGFRYSQSYARQATGGCGIYDVDADWANATALPTINLAVRNAMTQTKLPNVKLLDLSHAFDGHQLCAKGVGLLEEMGLPNWHAAGAADKSEWIDQIRIFTWETPYFQQESLHPNYWGQLALRACLRQAYNRGNPRGGSCRIAGPGLNTHGEPNMTLG